MFNIPWPFPDLKMFSRFSSQWNCVCSNIWTTMHFTHCIIPGQWPTVPRNRPFVATCRPAPAYFYFYAKGLDFSKIWRKDSIWWYRITGGEPERCYDPCQVQLEITWKNVGTGWAIKSENLTESICLGLSLHVRWPPRSNSLQLHQTILTVIIFGIFDNNIKTFPFV